MVDNFLRGILSREHCRIQEHQSEDEADGSTGDSRGNKCSYGGPDSGGNFQEHADANVGIAFANVGSSCAGRGCNHGNEGSADGIADVDPEQQYQHWNDNYASTQASKRAKKAGKKGPAADHNCEFQVSHEFEKKGGPPAALIDQPFCKSYSALPLSNRKDCVSLKLTADSAGSVISRLPVRPAPAVPAPPPTSAPMAAPLPPPANAPINAPAPAPPPIIAALRLPLPVEDCAMVEVATECGTPCTVTDVRVIANSAAPLKRPADFALVTSPDTLDPAGMTVSPPTTTGSTRLPVKLCPLWLILDPTASVRRTRRTVPAGTIFGLGGAGLSAGALSACIGAGEAFDGGAADCVLPDAALLSAEVAGGCCCWELSVASGFLLHAAKMSSNNTLSSSRTDLDFGINPPREIRRVRGPKHDQRPPDHRRPVRAR